MISFFKLFKSMDEKKHIDLDCRIPDIEKTEFRRSLESALKAQERLWEDYTNGMEIYVPNTHVIREL